MGFFALRCAMGLCLLPPAPAGRKGSPAVDPRPNLLVIVLDDVGNDYVASYGEGPVEHQPRTPALDSLAREGLRFTNAYSQPLCTPTRATFLTGRYGFRTGMTHLSRDSDLILPLEEWTIAEALQQQGYTSVLLGKWHLGHHGNRLLEPVVQGFDAFQGTRGNLARFKNYSEWTAWPWQAMRRAQPGYEATVITDQAISLIEKLPQPWFVVVSHHLAHRPLHVPPVSLHSYGQDPGDEQHHFMAMVEALDHEVGRLLSHVNRKDTTIVAFGDNGTERQFSEYDHAKGTVYEAGVNVPLIMAGAGVPHRGERSDALVQIVDLHATLIEMAGGRSQADDSVSMLPLMQDPGARTRDWVYSELERVTGEPLLKQMAREDRYKLMRLQDPFGGVDELFFDLATAPPNGDGEPLCQNSDGGCPGGLSPRERQAYDSLAALLDTIRDS